METWRSLYPRFYFIGDDDLIKLLGGLNSNLLWDVCSKLFPGIKNINYNESSKSVNAIESELGEVLNLN